MIVANNV